MEDFIQDKTPNHRKETVKVTCDADQYFILFGGDIQTGVAGFGNTPDGAYIDFVDNWKIYKRADK